ncbi:hypothetical protein PQY72_00320 [Pelagibacteraceae bacterium]|nr:hypothetical protein [Pelagibacteraceae bacterium]
MQELIKNSKFDIKCYVRASRDCDEFRQENLKKNTGLLLKFGDVALNINWKFMDKCEALFEEMNIKPLVGIIPIEVILKCIKCFFYRTT